MCDDDHYTHLLRHILHNGSIVLYRQLSPPRSPATPLTERVVGMRVYVTWKFSVQYYRHASPIPKQEFPFLTVLCCVAI